MNIVLPILFFAVGIGLYAPRMTLRLWGAMVLWIVLVIGFYYVKH